jgi:hypothetical protein
MIEFRHFLQRLKNSAGIDVWHSKTQDSIAGVVASFNETLTRYYSETSVQKKCKYSYICRDLADLEVSQQVGRGQLLMCRQIVFCLMD